MRKPNIVFLDEYTVNGSDLSAIKSMGNYTGYYFTSPDQTAERCKNADIVITNKVVLDSALLHTLPTLRLICVAATGTNNIDTVAASDLGIIVKNAAGYSTESVAEATIGSALALRHQISYYDNYVKSGNYSASPYLFNFDRPIRMLHGSNWGIIGLGNIGRKVAKIASALGCDIAYTSTSGIKREEEYRQMELGELLPWADIISIHAPLNENTKNLIGKTQFELMKPDAILINVARGGIINESDLASILNENRIAGAAIDVFSKEPLNADSPLLQIKDPYKLLLSPHNAWSADQAIDKLVKCVASNIKEFLELP